MTTLATFALASQQRESRGLPKGSSMGTSKAPIALAEQEGKALWLNHDLIVFKPLARKPCVRSSCSSKPRKAAR
jgi:hypothetical protein